MSDAEAALTLKATAYEAAFDLAIDLKSDAANAASDLASQRRNLPVASCGEGASKRWLEISLEDAAAYKFSRCAYLWREQWYEWNRGVSDDGVISYTASDDLLASLQRVKPQLIVFTTLLETDLRVFQSISPK